VDAGRRKQLHVDRLRRRRRQGRRGPRLEIPSPAHGRLGPLPRQPRLPSRFQVRSATTLLTYGEKPVVEEDNELKLYWDWAFAWEGHDATLPKGKVRLDLLSAFAEKQCRQVDCIVLTTNESYRPLIKERPRHPTQELLRRYRREGFDPAMEPLARRSVEPQVPASWKPATFRDKGFLYLWNMGHVKWADEDPKRVPFPYHIGDKDVLAAFEKKYAGATEIPIFSDPRIVPAFHDVGPRHPGHRRKGPGEEEGGRGVRPVARRQPRRAVGADDETTTAASLVTPAAKENFDKYRDRYVGNIAAKASAISIRRDADLQAATAAARTRRDLVAAFSPLCLASNAEKYRKVFGADLPDAYRDVIPWRVQSDGPRSRRSATPGAPGRSATNRRRSRPGSCRCAWRSCGARPGRMGA
jgi:hypothetical protein